MAKKKQKQINNNESSSKLNFILKEIAPLTQNQKSTFTNYASNQNLLLIGSAGSGKTFLSTYLGINEILNGSSEKKKLYII